MKKLLLILMVFGLGAKAQTTVKSDTVITGLNPLSYGVISLTATGLYIDFVNKTIITEAEFDDSEGNLIEKAKTTSIPFAQMNAIAPALLPTIYGLIKGQMKAQAVGSKLFDTDTWK